MHGGQRVTANSLRFPEVQSRAAPMAPQGDRCTHDATPLSDRQENRRTFWSQIAANPRSCGAKPSSLRAQATPGIQGRCLGSRHTLLLSPRKAAASVSKRGRLDWTTTERVAGGSAHACSALRATLQRNAGVLRWTGHCSFGLARAAGASTPWAVSRVVAGRMPEPRPVVQIVSEDH